MSNFNNLEDYGGYAMLFKVPHKDDLPVFEEFKDWEVCEIFRDDYLNSYVVSLVPKQSFISKVINFFKIV